MDQFSSFCVIIIASFYSRYHNSVNTMNKHNMKYIPYPGRCEIALEVIKPPALSWRALLPKESTGNSDGSKPWLEESETGKQS